MRLLESELERQNGKLDQLQKTLLEQQQTIQTLIEKLSAQPTAVAAAVKESETIVAETSASAEPQAPTVEQRLDKVESQVLKIGPSAFERRLSLTVRRNFSLRDATAGSATRSRTNCSSKVSLSLKSRYGSLSESQFPRSSRHRTAQQRTLNQPGLYVDHRAGAYFSE